ncbi:MAG TPA: helix-turn-helix domain-containing protein [Geminicoccus sp.]|uniref:helix-turn-helix domain-containing protein n=1 Tax=Geminicoccus sp. TaxID=2024832 RepID=UPI002E31658A|nr:helix-turn-helix domain-containing protein [Geminicoccus sp.]HEX2528266.1 helix-turn-helix domain-containing protein [Geminicoccus sp.]
MARRGMTLLGAKRALEEMLASGRAFVAVPTVEDADVLMSELAAAGVAAKVLAKEPSVDVKAIRERLSLSQEQFALRYGLDVDAVRNWERGRRQPDRAARSYLRVLAREPALVAEALVGR